MEIDEEAPDTYTSDLENPILGDERTPPAKEIETSKPGSERPDRVPFNKLQLRVETFRWVGGFYFLLLGMSRVLIPPDNPVFFNLPWLRGFTTALAGFVLLWLSVTQIPRRQTFIISLVITLPLLYTVFEYLSSGVLSPAATLLLFTLGMLYSPYAPPPSTEKTYRPDALGLILGGVMAVQGFDFIIRPAAGGAVPSQLGLPVSLLGSVFLLNGLAVILLQYLPATPRPIVWCIHLLAGFLLIGLWLSQSIFITQEYWVAGIASVLRAVAIAILPWWSPRVAGFDGHALRPRVALALITAAILPILLALPLVLNILDPNEQNLLFARQVAFGLSSLLALAAGGLGWWLAGQLTIPITALIQGVDRIARGKRNMTLSRQGTTELVNLSASVDRMARTLDDQRLEQFTARKRADFLATAGSHLSASLDYEKTLATLAELAVPDLADWCIVDIKDQNNAIRRVAVACADPAKAAVAAELKALLVDPAKSHPVTTVLATGQPIFQPDVTSYTPELAFGHIDYVKIASKIVLRSRIIVPMTVNGKVIGAFSLIYSRPDRIYNESDMQFATELTRRAAVAVENARLYQAEQQANQRLTRLQNATAALSEALTVEQVSTVIINQCFEVMNAQTGSVALVNESAGRVEVVRSIGYPQELVDQWRYILLDHASPLAVCARTGQPIWLGRYDAEVAAQFPDLVAIQAITGGKALAALPLIVEDRVIGAISFSFTESQEYAEAERTFMLTLSQLCAQALERARLYEEQQQAYRQEALLNEVSTTLAQTLDYEQTLQSICRLLVPRLGDYCAIYLLDELGRANLSASHHIDPEKLHLFNELQNFYQAMDNPNSPARQVMLTKKTLFYERIGPEEIARFANTEEVAKRVLALATRSVIFVPLITRQQVIGSITLGLTAGGSRLDSEYYTQDDLTLVEEVARRVVVAIDNARLYRQNQQALETQKELDNLKDLFISMAGHELRNPLASIKGFGQVLQRQLLNQIKNSPDGQEQGKEQEKFLRPLEYILRQSDRMNELIRQLLDFSRLQNDKLELNIKENINLIELVAQVIEQQQAATEDNRKLELQASQGAIIGKWDSDRVEQVLTNLISNAIKYSPSDKPITVGIEQRSIPTGQAGDVPLSGRFREAVIWVKDEGEGISPEHLSHLFDRFYRVRTKENDGVEGLGLGLYISHEIVKQHGGRMWVESRESHGSTFYFTLPLTSNFLPIM